MRRLLTALLLTSIVTVPAFSSPFTVGIRGGSSIPDLRDNSGGNELSTGWSSRVAPFAGVTAEWHLASPWSVQAELDYAPQGGQRDGLQPVTDANLIMANGGQFPYARYKDVAKLNYLEIPILAKYTFAGPTGLNLVAGPYVGFLLSANEVTSGSSMVFTDKSAQGAIPIGSQDFGATTDTKSSLNSFNWGFQAGFGTSHPMGEGSVTLDVRAGLGLANIQKDAVDGKNTTGNLVVALGYAVPFGGR